MGSLSAWHWLIVLAAVLLLFGSAKLPQMARSLGQSARVLKAEARGLKEDEQAASRPTTEQDRLDTGKPSPQQADDKQQVDGKQRNDPKN
ncbi:Sec-independent protein translocase subunit TatA [Saccharopolyspora sp. ASAGF58]|uniref:Sec-independent protein translocase subunit TatA n=1 Tax=Saccharopolyspora sp. ASAGF58 TaxID=2719023 RepID=UPI00143FBF5B|nr:twin-arginine translocase TatA/TatE family subunit [Saccharopolyspora sp. ASAGF58]